MADANSVVIYASGAVIGDDLAPPQLLATLPIAIVVVGMAACILPIDRYAQSHGRRAALLLGSSAGVLAGLLAMLAVLLGPFWLFCLATFFGAVQ